MEVRVIAVAQKSSEPAMNTVGIPNPSYVTHNVCEVRIDAAVVFEPSSTFFARYMLYLGHTVAGYNQQSQFTKLSDKDNGVHPNT